MADRKRQAWDDPPSQPRLLLRVEEAAERLGLSRATVYELVLSGEIRSLKIGAARRVPVAALEEFVAQRLDEDGVA